MGMVKPLRPWFTNQQAGRQGDRTTNQQLVGLAPLFDGRVQGKTVLDLGCAEGHISHMLHKAGAELCHGVDIQEEYIRWAIRTAGGGVPRSADKQRRKDEVPGYRFEVQDLNTWRPVLQYDVVLALASLHKLREPAKACAEFAAAAKELMIIRLPGGKGEVIVDERSGNVPQPIGEVMRAAGFRAGHQEVGTFNELTVYYERT